MRKDKEKERKLKKNKEKLSRKSPAEESAEDPREESREEFRGRPVFDWGKFAEVLFHWGEKTWTRTLGFYFMDAHVLHDGRSCE